MNLGLLDGYILSTVQAFSPEILVRIIAAQEVVNQQ
jgi:hypothetical protein